VRCTDGPFMFPSFTLFCLHLQFYVKSDKLDCTKEDCYTVFNVAIPFAVITILYEFIPLFVRRVHTPFYSFCVLMCTLWWLM